MSRGSKGRCQPTSSASEAALIPVRKAHRRTGGPARAVSPWTGIANFVKADLKL